MENAITENALTCDELRLRGRESLKGRWKEVLPVAFLFALLSSFSVSFSGTAGNVVSSVWSICSIILLGPVTFALCSILLAVSKGENTRLSVPFGKAVGLGLYRFLFVFLWSLLFIVPGIIAAFRYSMAFCIMAEDPSKGIRECMNESKEMMKGQKGRLFLLYLSFAGWYILAYVFASIPLIHSVIGAVSAMGVEGTVTEIPLLADILFAVLVILTQTPLCAYLKMSVVKFYESLKVC